MNLLQLIHGTNIRRINEMATGMAKDYLGEIDDFNLIKMNIKEHTIETLIDEAQILPMFSDAKVIIVTDAFIFTGQKVRAEVKHNIDLLVEYLESKNDDTLIIFEVYSEKLDKRKKITKLMSKNGKVSEVKPMSENELKKFVRESFLTNDIQISPDALERLISKTGVEYETVMNEIEKLVLYADDQIHLEDIEDVVSDSLESNVFKVSELILGGKKVEAVNLVRHLILQKEEPIKLLALITRQFRLMYQVKLLSDKGFDQDFIARTIKSHPYPVQLAARSVRGVNVEMLLKKIIKCRDIDYQMKSSYLDKQTLFETFILEV